MRVQAEVWRHRSTHAVFRDEVARSASMRPLSVAARSVRSVACCAEACLIGMGNIQEKVVNFLHALRTRSKYEHRSRPDNAGRGESRITPAR